MKIHEYFTLCLNKIKIVPLSSAEVITKYAFFVFVYRLVLQSEGKFMCEAGMRKGYLPESEAVGISVNTDTSDVCVSDRSVTGRR